MTVAELYKQVAQLGFEDSLEDDDRFYFAANRALLQVNEVRPAISYYLINHKPLKNLLTDSTFDPVEKDDDLLYSAEGAKSYYFEADGNGVVYIEKHTDDGWSMIDMVQLESARQFVAYRGFIKEAGEFVGGLVRLRFTGEFLYTVKNVALYAKLYSADEADIPAYEPFTRYDINKLTTDFLALCCPPIKEAEGNTILNQEYGIEGSSVILLPYNHSGVFKVLYKKRPAPIIDNGEMDDETEIDLDAELCALLPVLIAAYVWIDDEPQKSEYYKYLYNEQAAEIERRSKDVSPVIIKSSNGW